MKHEFAEWAQWPELHSIQSYNSIPSVSLDILVLRNSHKPVPLSHQSSSNVRLVSMTLSLFFCHYLFLTCSDILATAWVMTAAASFLVYWDGAPWVGNHMNLPELQITCTPLERSVVEQLYGLSIKITSSHAVWGGMSRYYNNYSTSLIFTRSQMNVSDPSAAGAGW